MCVLSFVNNLVGGKSNMYPVLYCHRIELPHSSGGLVLEVPETTQREKAIFDSEDSQN